MLEIQLSPLVFHIQYLPLLINFLRVPNELNKFVRNSRYFWILIIIPSINDRMCVTHIRGEISGVGWENAKHVANFECDKKNFLSAS